MIHITHDDLDGIACMVLSKSIDKHTESRYVSYTNAPLLKYISELLLAPRRVVLITDINISNDINYLEYLAQRLSVLVIDHHQTLCNLDGTKVQYCIDVNRCAAKIYFDILVRNQSFLKVIKVYKYFVELVNVYDLAQFKHSLYDNALNLNRALYALINYTDTYKNMGYKEKLDAIVNLIVHEPLTETATPYWMKQALNTYNEYFNKLRNAKNTIEYDNIRVLVVPKSYPVFDDVYIQQIKNNFGGLLVYVTKNNNKLIYSLRSIEYNNLHIIAKQFGGGGHKHAAGFSVDSNIALDKIISKIEAFLDASNKH